MLALWGAVVAARVEDIPAGPVLFTLSPDGIRNPLVASESSHLQGWTQVNATTFMVLGSAAMNKEYWLGVDLSKTWFDASIASNEDVVEHWDRLPVRRFENRRQGCKDLTAWLNRELKVQGELKGICIESTGRLGLRWILELGDSLAPVSMVNPARPKQFGQSLGIRDKNDRNAAQILALYAVTVKPRPTLACTPAQRKLRELSRAYDELVRQRVADELRLQDSPESREVRTSLRHVIACLNKEIQSIEEQMDVCIEQSEQFSEDARRLQTIPCIGPKTVRVLLAELGDLRRFSREELTSYAGLYPRQHESGTSVRKRPRMVKQGGSRIRQAMYLCALTACRYNPPMKRLYERLLKNGKCPMAALGAVMRKLLLTARSLLVHNACFDPLHA